MNTYAQLYKLSSLHRNNALNYLSYAAKEINNSARLTNYYGSNALYQKHSIHSVSRDIEDAFTSFRKFHLVEFAIKEHQKECKKFINKRYKK